MCEHDFLGLSGFKDLSSSGCHGASFGGWKLNFRASLSNKRSFDAKGTRKDMLKTYGDFLIMKVLLVVFLAGPSR